MVTIEESDFRLTQVSDTSIFWDLELLCTIRPKDKEPRQEFKQSGYGLTMEHAIKKIANFRIANKHPNAINMKTYLSEYKKIIEEIKTICQE